MLPVRAICLNPVADGAAECLVPIEGGQFAMSICNEFCRSPSMRMNTRDGLGTQIPAAASAVW